MKLLEVPTSKRQEFIDITREVQRVVDDSNVKNGICIIQSLHTTAGITVNENADPDVKTDLIKALSVFDNFDFDHAEGNSPAHVKTSYVGPSVTIIVYEGKLQLGTWQSVFFSEFDGPRRRKVIVQVIKE